jgi:hypothetical protein
MAKCMQCGGMKKTAKMKLGGSAIKKAPVQLYGIPQENMGTSGQYGQMKKGGATKSTTKKPLMKKGGSMKKPLRKAQTGRAMTSGPFDKATTDYLNTKYPGTAVRIPRDPEYYAEPQSQSDYTPMAELEAKDRRNTEARMRSANNREDFNAGSMEGYRRGGAKKAMMKKGGAVKKMAKGGTKFPDLTGDGKVTKADVLKGRGVIKKTGGTPKAKFGMSVKVQRSPKAGKVTAVGRGYAAVGKREPGRIIKKTIAKKK